MAITQISNKTEITLRANLERALNHGEADQNFKQLLNVIEDVSALIKAVSKIDELQDIIDNSLSAPLKKFEDQMEVMTTRVQSTIDSLNKSSTTITETKEIANTSHNQITKAAKTLFPGTAYEEDNIDGTDTLMKILEIACPQFSSSATVANGVNKGVVNYREGIMRYQSPAEGNNYDTIVTTNTYQFNPIVLFFDAYAKASKESGFAAAPSWFVDEYVAMTIGPFAIAQYVEYNYVPRSTYAKLEARVAELEKKLSGG